MRTKKILAVFTILIIASFVLAGMAMAAEGKKMKRQFFTIVTGGVGGVYYPLGGALASYLSSRYQWLAANSQTGNGSVANVNLLGRRELESAWAQNNVAFVAYNGRKDLGWKGPAIKNIRAVASLYPETIQVVALKKANIKTIPDIRGKNVAVGDRGSGTEFDCRRIVEAHNMTYKDFNADYVDFQVAAQRLQDESDVVLFKTAGYPTSALIEISTMKEVNWVSLTDEAIKKLTTDYPYYVPITMPANVYKGQDYQVKSIAMMACWYVDDTLSDDMVYKLCQALWEPGTLYGREGDKPISGAQALAMIHSQGKNITLDTALLGLEGVPLHPGAEKYYKEKGLIK